MSDNTRITVGSDNIYADLGSDNPEEEQAKAELARQIATLIEQRGLTQVGAAQILQTDQARISNLRRGRLGGFSMDRLLSFLRRLNQDVRIEVSPTEPSRPGRIAVSYPEYDDLAIAATPKSGHKSDGVQFS